MVGAEDPLGILEGLLLQRDRPPQIPGRLVDVREVVAGSQGVGVVRGEDPLAIFEGPLEQRDRPPQIPGRLIGAGEPVAAEQRVRVVDAKVPLGLISEFAEVSNGLGDQSHLFQRSAAAEQGWMGTGLVVPQSVGVKRAEGGGVGSQRLG